VAAAAHKQKGGKCRNSCTPALRNQNEWAECVYIFQSVPRRRGGEKG